MPTTFALVIKTDKRMRQILIIMAAMLMACCSKENKISAQDTLDYKMNITIDGQTKSVTLAGNNAAKSLVAASVYSLLTSSGTVSTKSA